MWLQRHCLLTHTSFHLYIRPLSRPSSRHSSISTVHSSFQGLTMKTSANTAAGGCGDLADAVVFWLSEQEDYCSTASKTKKTEMTTSTKNHLMCPIHKHLYKISNTSTFNYTTLYKVSSRTLFSKPLRTPVEFLLSTSLEMFSPSPRSAGAYLPLIFTAIF